MAKLELTTKRIQLDKANVAIVIIVAVACFVTVFSLVAAKGLLGQLTYQNKVISQKETAKNQLVASVKGRDELVDRYRDFVSSDVNAIGGNAAGSGDRDGDNAKIVLDALPSKYDYPALTSSLEKLATSVGLTISSVTGTDDEVAQSAVSDDATPQPVEMPYTISVTGDKSKTEAFLGTLQKSIRPMQVQKVTITGNDNALTTTITAKTYYQPEKIFKVTKEVVK